MPQSLACMYVHNIFSTKNRAPAIGADLQPRLYEYIGGILRNEKCALLAAGGMSDHGHLLISISRELSIAGMVRAIKANSSKWIHETFAEQSNFAWQNGYAVFSVSYSNLDSVKRYLDRQAEHHRATTFKDELIMFLKRHHLEYDERYLWD